MQLCALGAQVTAVDISARRMKRLGENLARSGLSAELVTADASKWTPAGKFDAILLDAPCSGTGTLRRHPDIAWLKDEEDVGRLMLAQDRLLLHALDLLKRERRAKLVPIDAAELPGLAEAASPVGDVRTLPSMWPERGGLDGFYIARLTID
jgi:16S rRNA (cytosine967-C5)-methyltransferase